MQTFLESTTHFQLSYSFGAINDNTSVSTDLVIVNQIRQHNDDPIMTRPAISHYEIGSNNLIRLSISSRSEGHPGFDF